MHRAEEEPNAGSGLGTSPSSTLLLLFQHQLGSFICCLEDKNRQQKEKIICKGERIGFIPHLKISEACGERTKSLLLACETSGKMVKNDAQRAEEPLL